MIVKGLELDFFRNYAHLETKFDPRVNLCCRPGMVTATAILH